MRSLGALARTSGTIFVSLLYYKFGSMICYLIGSVLILIPFVLLLPLPNPTELSRIDLKKKDD